MLWKKEKIMVTSIFSICHNVFKSPYPKDVKTMQDMFGNFRLVHNKSIFRLQNKCDCQIKICSMNGGKHCWLLAFSPFLPDVFFKTLDFFKLVKSQDFLGMGKQQC